MRKLFAVLTMFFISPSAAFGKLVNSTVETFESKKAEYALNEPYLCSWNGKPALMKGGTVELIDISKGRSILDESAFPLNSQSVFMNSSGDLFALTRNQRNCFLHVKNSGRWRSVVLPEIINSGKTNFNLYESGGNLFLVSEDRICFKKDGAWRQELFSKFKIPEIVLNKKLPRVVLNDEDIYLAYDGGEYGGAIISYNFKKCAFENYFLDLPITDLTLDKHKRLWLTASIDHMRSIDSKLYNLVDGKLKLIAAVKAHQTSDSRGIRSKYEIEEQFNWNSPPAVFNSISFDENDLPVLLTDSEGIMRYKDALWHTIIDAQNLKAFKIKQITVFGNCILCLTEDRRVFKLEKKTQGFSEIFLTKKGKEAS